MIAVELTKRVPFRALTRPTLNSLILSAQKVLKIPAKFVLSVAVVSDKEIRKVNREHRGKDKATDVLSFRYDDLSGEIIISADRVRAQAKEFNNTISQEAAFMVVHGITHIMGYDHERSAKAAKEQQQLEQKILKQCGFTYAR